MQGGKITRGGKKNPAANNPDFDCIRRESKKYKIPKT